MTTRDALTAGRGWVKLGIILGGGVSVAANIAHSFIPPAGSPATWHPQPGAVFFAMVWPVFLFIAIEILVKPAWPHEWYWQILRWVGLLPVALVSGLVSYRHLSGLLAYYGEDHIVSMLGPIAVDGVMAMATGALIAINANIHRTTAASAAPAPIAPIPAPEPSTVDAPPAPVAPAKSARPRKATTTKAPATKRTSPRKTTTPPVSAPQPIGESAASPASPAPVVPAAPAPAPAPSTTDTHVAPVQAATLPKPPVPAAMLTRATHVAQAHQSANGSPITPGELAVRMRVNSDTAEQLLAVLALDPDTPLHPVTTVNGARVPA